MGKCYKREEEEVKKHQLFVTTARINMEPNVFCGSRNHCGQDWAHFLSHKQIEHRLLDEITWRWNALKPDPSRIDDIFKLQLEIDQKLQLLCKELHHEDLDVLKARHNHEEEKRKIALKKKEDDSEDVCDFLDKKCLGNKHLDYMLNKWNSIKPVPDCMSDIWYLQDELIEKMDALMYHFRFCMKRCAREVTERKKLLCQQARDKAEETKKEETMETLETVEEKGEDTVE